MASVSAAVAPDTATPATTAELACTGQCEAAYLASHPDARTVTQLAATATPAAGVEVGSSALGDLSSLRQALDDADDPPEAVLAPCDRPWQVVPYGKAGTCVCYRSHPHSGLLQFLVVQRRWQGNFSHVFHALQECTLPKKGHTPTEAEKKERTEDHLVGLLTGERGLSTLTTPEVRLLAGDFETLYSHDRIPPQWRKGWRNMHRGCMRRNHALPAVQDELQQELERRERIRHYREPKDQWMLPKGTRERDESFEAAGRRELHEEACVPEEDVVLAPAEIQNDFQASFDQDDSQRGRVFLATLKGSHLALDNWPCADSLETLKAEWVSLAQLQRERRIARKGFLLLQQAHDVLLKHGVGSNGSRDDAQTRDNSAAGARATSGASSDSSSRAPPTPYLRNGAPAGSNHARGGGGSRGGAGSSRSDSGAAPQRDSQGGSRYQLRGAGRFGGSRYGHGNGNSNGSTNYVAQRYAGERGSSSSSARGISTCFQCGEAGHKVPDCPQRSGVAKGDAAVQASAEEDEFTIVVGKRKNNHK